MKTDAERIDAILGKLNEDCPDCGGCGLVVVMDFPTGSYEACQNAVHARTRSIRDTLASAGVFQGSAGQEES